MNQRLRLATYLSAAVATSLMAGCFSAKPDASQYYVLTALPASAAPQTPPEPNLAIGVFSPDMPSYLDQPQIVARAGENLVTKNDFQRWAEPLPGGFSRVLIQDIALLTGTSQVALFPMTRTYGQEFEVYLMVLEFDGVPGGNVTLRVHWRITGPGGVPNFVVQDSVFTQPSSASATNYTGYVSAMSTLVGDLAKAIVAAIPQARTAEEKAAADQAEEAAMNAQVAAAKPPTVPAKPADAAPAPATTPATPPAAQP
jgi:uncharacterized lipoprotein YmbA